MSLRLTVPKGRRTNPLAALERLPGWWLGKAETRRQLAHEALAKRREDEAAKHLRLACIYEELARERQT